MGERRKRFKISHIQKPKLSGTPKNLNFYTIIKRINLNYIDNMTIKFNMSKKIPELKKPKLSQISANLKSSPYCESSSKTYKFKVTQKVLFTQKSNYRNLKI